MSCLKCNTPNEGICYWWCEELKGKIHPNLMAEFIKNAEGLKKSKMLKYRIWNKIKSLTFIRLSATL